MGPGRDLEPAVVVAITVGISFGYLLGLLIVAFFFRQRLDTRLIMMGLLTVVAAVCYGAVTGHTLVAGGSAGRPDTAGVWLGAVQGLPGSVLRIGFVLVLGGITVAVWPGLFGRVSAGDTERRPADAL